jgi:hypothetical protein
MAEVRPTFSPSWSPRPPSPAVGTGYLSAARVPNPAPCQSPSFLLGALNHPLASQCVTEVFIERARELGQPGNEVQLAPM